MQIWDTAGQERFRTITGAYYKGAHAILIVYDITKKESFEDIDTFWIGEVSLPIHRSKNMPVLTSTLPSSETNQIFRSSVRSTNLKLKVTARPKISSTSKSVLRVETTSTQPSRKFQKCSPSFTPKNKRSRKPIPLQMISERKERNFSFRRASRPSTRIKNPVVYESHYF